MKPMSLKHYLLPLKGRLKPPVLTFPLPCFLYVDVNFDLRQVLTLRKRAYIELTPT